MNKFGCGPDQYQRDMERDSKWQEQEEERAHAARVTPLCPTPDEQLLDGLMDAIKRIANLECLANESELELRSHDERLRKLEKKQEIAP